MQIRASSIWMESAESQHKHIQGQMLDYHLKITLRGTNFDTLPMKFEGSTDDSQLEVQLGYNRGKKLWLNFVL